MSEIKAVGPGQMQGRPGVTAKSVAWRVFHQEYTVLLLVLLGVIAAFAGISKGVTLTLNNVASVWTQSASRGIASIGQLFVILTGGIDISIGGNALMCAIIGAKLMTGLTGGVPSGPIAIVLLAGLAVGLANGGLISRVGIPALIATLGVWQMTDGAAFVISRGESIRKLPESVGVFGGGNIGGMPVIVIIFLAVAVVAYFVLNRTTFGRSIYAVGGNPVSAWLSGVRVQNVLLSTYAISGFLAGLAGFLIMSRLLSANMTAVVNLEMDSIAAVVIGGVSLRGGIGGVVGAVIGVLILAVVQNGMVVLGVDAAYQQIVKGAIIILAVAIDYIRRR